MTSVDSNFNFLCGRPHGAGPSLPPSTCDHLSLTPPPPSGRHKWMAPNLFHSHLLKVLASLLQKLNIVKKTNQWRNYVRRLRRGEAAASGCLAAEGTAKFNQNYFVGL